jgi:hypothetical protein
MDVANLDETIKVIEGAGIFGVMQTDTAAK